ncbi:hypothetical protein L0U85_10915 [Glycomyces sp. L485]|uniref:hypothetical protein n=1 Tax=Glycomyces sp. L485 TaxID=2909235 RepID=UPI001F4A13ED|nr:hypothetical protein [Glycomyces sp. L485]MCH7231355.1 hypothetical protein [Glycomyces sp. L485]
MKALEYGYQVSLDYALAADGTQAASEGGLKWNDAEIKKTLRSNGAAFAFLVLSLLLTYFVSLQFGPLIILGVLLLCAMYIANALRSRKEPPISKLIFTLSTGPWQAWPCRVEGVRGNPDSKTKLVYLMSPDQQVVRAFKAPIPEHALKRIAHGMGVLWICGDLESPPMSGASGVAMATVKGEIVWGSRYASKRDAENGPQPTPALSRFIDEASSAEMDYLLNPGEPR